MKIYEVNKVKIANGKKWTSGRVVKKGKDTLEPIVMKILYHPPQRRDKRHYCDIYTSDKKVKRVIGDMEIEWIEDNKKKRKCL